MTNDRPHENEENVGNGGFSLVIVLLFLVAAAAVLTPFTIAMRTHSLVVRNALEEWSSRQALANIVQVGAFVATLGELSGLRWPQSTLVCEVTWGDRVLLLSYLNHSGLVDLNSAPPELLALGFRALGVSGREAAEIAAMAAAFRTNIAESGTLTEDVSVSVVGGRKGSGFEAVAELSDFRGLQKVPDWKFHRVFTVHSKAGTLDRLRLPPLMQAEAHRAGSAEGYLVESGSRTPAVTIEAKLHVKGRFEHSARTVFSPTGEGTTPFHLLEPISFEALGPAENERGKSRSDEMCARYFPPDTRQLLAELLG